MIKRMLKREAPLNNHWDISDLQELIMYREKICRNTFFCYRDGECIISVTPGKFKSDIEGLGTYLYSKNIFNRKIALLGENSYMWIVAFFAVINGGNTVVPIDRDLPKDKITHIMKETRAGAMFYSEEFSETAGEYPKLSCFNLSDFDRMVEEGKKLIESGDLTFVDYQVNRKDTCSIVYEPDSSGRLNGVMLSHENYAAEVMSACENVRLRGETILALPLSSTFAFLTGVLMILMQGSPIFIDETFEITDQKLIEYRPRNVLLKASQIEELYRDVMESIEELGISKLIRKRIWGGRVLRLFGIDIRRKLFQDILEWIGGVELLICGGESVNEECVRGFGDLGVTVLNGYCHTECTSLVAINRNHNIVRGSAGRLLSCCEAEIVDGELCVRGKNVMQGYYRKNITSGGLLKDGLFHTGMKGYIKNNYLYIKEKNG